jgi:hypothetical protein
VGDLNSLGYAMHVNMLYQTKISLYIKNLSIILVLNAISCLSFEFVSFRCARSLEDDVGSGDIMDKWC